jgi:hypothetical protein
MTLQEMLTDYETYLQDSSDRMSGSERHEYSADDRRDMKKKLADAQKMQQLIG